MRKPLRKARPAARAADRAAYGDPRLAAVVNAWTELPEETKAAIVALAEDAKSEA